MNSGLPEYEVVEAMLNYGGNFVQQLARAIRAVNKKKLVDAFREYIDQYREMARLTAQREAQAGRPRPPREP